MKAGVLRKAVIANVMKENGEPYSQSFLQMVLDGRRPHDGRLMKYHARAKIIELRYDEMIKDLEKQTEGVHAAYLKEINNIKI